MKKYTQKAFTLVELIVVITILAILATVAFISLGGQTENARNTVKKDAIGKLATAVENSRTTGVSIASFDLNSNSTLSTGNIAGVAVTTVTTKVNAGDINLGALDVKQEDFKDNGKSYKFGYSNFRGGKYEIAGTLKEGEIGIAYLVGNYEARTVAGSTVTGVIDTTNGKKFNITLDSDIRKVSVGDTVDDGTNATLVVTGVSSDYKTITVDAAITAAATTLALANAETSGLIESTTGGTPVTNASQAIPYTN